MTLKYIKADISDLEKIRQLHCQIFRSSPTIEGVYWKYKTKNYDLNSFIIKDGDSVLGHYGAVPFDFYLNGKMHQCLSIVDVMTDAKIRSSFQYLKLLNTFFEFHYNKNQFLFPYGFPNERALKIGLLKKLYISIDQLNEIVIQTRPIFDQRLILKFELLPDESLDKLWNKLNSLNYFGIVKDCKFIAYRYLNNPFYKYRYISVRAEENVLAFIVIKQEGKDVKLMDLITDINDEDLVYNLLTSVLNFLFINGIKSISMLFPLNSVLFKIASEFKNNFNQIGQIVYAYTSDPKMLDIIFNENNFFYSFGDTDTN